MCWAAAGCVATYAMVSIEGRGHPWRTLPQAPLIGTCSYSIYLIQPMTITPSCLFTSGGFWWRSNAALATNLLLGCASH